MKQCRIKTCLRNRAKPVVLFFSGSGRAWILVLLLTACLFFSGGCSAFRPHPGTHVSPGIRNEIVNIALQHKNSPYKWNGDTPAGFDCSGFVRFVYRQAGFEIPRTSTQQFRAGHKIARANLKKGDLVFFKKWKLLGSILSPSHVGIYIGENRFIHSPGSAGVVRIDHLDNQYWSSHYKGARMLLE